MRTLSDTGILLRLLPHGEDGMVAHVFTPTAGRVAGYIPRARAGSGKLRGLLVAGQRVALHWQARNDDQLGTLTVEEDESQTLPLWAWDDRAKAAHATAIALLQLTLPERQVYEGLYDATSTLFDVLDNEDIWPIVYVRWELGLLATLGYGVKLDACVVSGETDPAQLTHISPKSGCAVSADAAAPYLAKLLRLPPFLRGLYDPPPTADDIRDGMAVSGHFLFHRLLDPLGKTLPEIRTQILPLTPSEPI